MTENQLNQQPYVRVASGTDTENTRVEVFVGDKAVSRLSIVPFRINVGSAIIPMEGIGGVSTDDEFRMQGHARLLMEASVKHMMDGKSAVSMLYGIKSFYPKFGYTTAGPEHRVVVKNLDRHHSLPAGWACRKAEPSDMSSIREIYDLCTANTSGSSTRFNNATWNRLLQTLEGQDDDECRVAISPDGEVKAYAWLADWCWYIRLMFAVDYPDVLPLGEIMAVSPMASDAILAICRQWTKERGMKDGVEYKGFITGMPPSGNLADAIKLQNARFEILTEPDGASMIRTLNVRRLLEAVLPELKTRIESTGVDYTGAVHFYTEIGTVSLVITRDRLVLRDGLTARDDDDHMVVKLPQSDLARLVLGSYNPEDILRRLPNPPSLGATELLSALFPQRMPHMYFPDRF